MVMVMEVVVLALVKQTCLSLIVGKGLTSSVVLPSAAQRAVNNSKHMMPNE